MFKLLIKIVHKLETNVVALTGNVHRNLFVTDENNKYTHKTVSDLMSMNPVKKNIGPTGSRYVFTFANGVELFVDNHLATLGPALGAYYKLEQASIVSSMVGFPMVVVDFFKRNQAMVEKEFINEISATLLQDAIENVDELRQALTITTGNLAVANVLLALLSTRGRFRSIQMRSLKDHGFEEMFYQYVKDVNRMNDSEDQVEQEYLRRNLSKNYYVNHYNWTDDNPDQVLRIPLNEIFTDGKY